MLLPKSPYDNVPESERVKLQAMVPQDDKFLIQSVFPQRGILLFAVESFVHALANDLKKYGINYYSDTNAECLIAFIRVRTNPELTNHKPERPHPRTASGLCESSSESPSESSDVHESPSGRIGRSGKRQSNQKEIKSTRQKSRE